MEVAQGNSAPPPVVAHAQALGKGVRAPPTAHWSTQVRRVAQLKMVSVVVVVVVQVIPALARFTQQEVGVVRVGQPGWLASAATRQALRGVQPRRTRAPVVTVQAPT